MTEKDVVRIIRNHFEEQFPRICPKCGLRSETLQDYFLSTSRIGDAISYDAEIHDWNPSEPLGIVAYSNCPCGTTMALGTKNMPVMLHHHVLRWVRSESLKRDINPNQLISYIRDQVRRQVLSDVL